MTPERMTFGGGASEGAPPPVAREVNLEQDANGEVEGSLLSELRHAAKEQQKEKVKDFVVGGEFGKRLWIRYKPLDPGPMDRFLARRAEIREQMEDSRQGLPFTELNMDLMAQGCVAIVGADGEGKNKMVLKDDDGPIKLEHRLVEFLQLPIEAQERLNAREVIMILFGGNAIAIVDHGDDLLAWMRNPASQPNVGES